MFVKLDKPDFIGKAALERAQPPGRRRVGLEIRDRGIAREGCPVYAGERQVGIITSGTHCPHLGKAVAMALLETDAQEPLTVDVRGRRLAAAVVPLPFYKRDRR
ncbi:Aminomethyltransferase [bioreactor metagenome]|uniref:Aminomethyltransferase n=1 Tax=bioreactor metagenome TaxID=1076179 RepID=A0A645BLA4_9ZZZZ